MQTLITSALTFFIQTLDNYIHVYNGFSICIEVRYVFVALHLDNNVDNLVLLWPLNNWFAMSINGALEVSYAFYEYDNGISIDRFSIINYVLRVL